MKSLIFILNLTIAYSAIISKSDLRNLYHSEKNNFIEYCINIISDSIITEIILNAKSNINQLSFDFSCNNQKVKIINEYTNVYISENPMLKYDDLQINDFTQQLIKQINNKCSLFNSTNIHYPYYLSNQNIITYDEGGINIIQKNKYPILNNYYQLLNVYKISDNTIIKLIIERLTNTFSDVEIKYINNNIDCCSYYLISW